MTRVLFAVVALALPACTGSPDAGSRQDTAAAVPGTQAAPEASPADSMVLEAPGGVTVWFTAARPAKDSLGNPCQERALQIRRDTIRAGVPLLYTREAPTLLDSTAMRAVLYHDCSPGPSYRVDFATVSPRRITP